MNTIINTCVANSHPKPFPANLNCLNTEYDTAKCFDKITPADLKDE